MVKDGGAAAVLPGGRWASALRRTMHGPKPRAHGRLAGGLARVRDF